MKSLSLIMIPLSMSACSDYIILTSNDPIVIAAVTESHIPTKVVHYTAH